MGQLGQMTSEPRRLMTNIDNPLERVQREVSALSRHAAPENVSWKRAKRAILEAAEYLRLQAEETKPPIGLERIARLRKINSREYFVGRAAPEAVLVPNVNRFQVKMAKGQAMKRQRSSLAHEIAHTFFYDIDKHPPARMLAHGDSGRSSVKEEDICKAFARELLMPRELVDSSVRRWHESDMALLLELSHAYDVSIEFASVRLLWDFNYFSNTIAMFSEADKSAPRGAAGRHRQYRGRHVKKLRAAEATAVHLVVDAIAAGPPFDGVAAAIVETGKTLDVEWRVDRGQQWTSLTALLKVRH